MKNFIKKPQGKKKPLFYVLGLLITGVLFIGIFNVIASATEESIPDHLQLKAPKEDMLGYKEFANGVVKYAYNSGVKISTETSNEAIMQAQKSNLNIVGELINKRTKHSKTFATNNKNKFVTEIISGTPQYYKDNKGEWWQADYATTTKELFDRQIQEKILGIFPVKKALATTNTFYPDESTGNTTVDGNVTRGDVNETWATIIAGTGTEHADNVAQEYFAMLRTSSASPNFSHFKRSFFLFDTSSIPDGDTVNSATFSVYGSSKVNQNSSSPDINLYSSNPASNNDLVNGDLQNVGTAAFSTTITYAGFSTTGYNDFTLNASGLANITKTGVSKFSLRNANYDVAQSVPTWNSASSVDGFYGYFADETGTSKDPKLVVVYSTPFNPVLKVRKTISESLLNSTTLQNDDHLTLILATSTTYIIDGVVFASTTSAVPDIKIAFIVPSGATMDLGHIAASDSTLRYSELLESSGAASISIPMVANTPLVIHIKGTIITTNTEGDFTLQWAQNTSNSNAITVIEGSYLRADEI